MVNYRESKRYRLLIVINLSTVGADPEVQVIGQFLAVRVRLVRLTDTDRLTDRRLKVAETVSTALTKCSLQQKLILKKTVATNVVPHLTFSVNILLMKFTVSFSYPIP